MDISSLMGALLTAVENAREQEEKLPEAMHLLRHFRHRYENSHSDVLAFMLSPQFRRPKKNAEFLRLFLDQVGFGEITSPKGLNENLDEAHVLRENGRVDLLILLKNTCIIIENKVDAGDQPAQLARYHQYVTKNYPIHKNIYILYLSLDGKDPSEQSIGKGGEDYQKELEAIEQLKKDGRFKCISYKNDIYKWLQDTLENIKGENFLETKGRLFSAVDQYLYNVEVLTGQTKGDNIMSEKIMAALLEWQKKNNPEPNNLLSLYKNLEDILPILKAYAKCMDIHRELINKNNNYKPIYFMSINNQPMEPLNEDKISQCSSIAVGIPTGEIPPMNLKNAYIVYKQNIGRGWEEFGLAPENPDSPEPSFNIPPSWEYLSSIGHEMGLPHWYFRYILEEEEGVGKITSWFEDLMNKL